VCIALLAVPHRPLVFRIMFAIAIPGQMSPCLARHPKWRRGHATCWIACRDPWRPLGTFDSSANRETAIASFNQLIRPQENVDKRKAVVLIPSNALPPKVVDWATIGIGAAIALAITVAAVIIGIAYTRRAARRRKVLVWTFAQSNVVGGFGAALPGLERLKLLFDDQPIPAASVSRVIVWNEGTESIPGESNTNEDPLRVELVEGVKLLDARLVDSSEGAMGVSVAPNPSSEKAMGLISFKFLNADSGFVVQVIHSGKPEQGVAVRGTLQDVNGPIYVPAVRPFMRHLGPVYLSMVAAFAIVYFLDPFPKGSDAAQYFLLAVFLAAVILPLYVLRRWPALWWRPPGKLKDFAGDPIPQPRRR
jgi:hypothetical protein